MHCQANKFKKPNSIRHMLLYTEHYILAIVDLVGFIFFPISYHFTDY